MTDREAMKMALAKLEHLWEIGIDAEYKVELLPEIEALRQALAQPEQEPVAWELRKGKTDRVLLEITNNPDRAHSWKCSLEEVVPLYAAPLKQEQGCAECGVKAIDGYALYCVACTEKFVGGYKENVPVHTSELLTQVSTGNHYSGNGTAGVQNKTKPTGFFFQMPPKQWVGLTDEEITDLWENNDTDWESIKRVEATLKEKNMSEQAPFDRLLRIMGTFDLATGHADNWGSLLDSLESELRDVLGHYREAFKAQPEPKPVAFIEQLTGKPKLIGGYVVRTDADIPLYMTPPKREWVGLTDDEIEHLRNDQPWWMVRDIEAKLKEKNT